jgi:8-oxo-dGTP pyrophosphatase MutT (NUDIX family)
MSPIRPPLPPDLVQTAQEYAAGARVPAVPRDAATVLLLREGASGPEVFMMVRRRSMAFAPGMAVFPGGSVDERDRVPGGIESAQLAERMGCTTPEAAALLRAAVRELAEETGVVVAPGDLGLWDAWTTPLFEPRRYRTWFFTARLPQGQSAEELSTESSSVAWVRAADALERMRSGEWMLMPPTYVSCLRLATFDSVDAVMAETIEARVEMFMPELVGDTLTSPAWAAALLEEE